MDQKLLRLTSSNTFIPLLLLFILCIAGLYAYSVAIHRDDTLAAAGKEVQNLASAMAMHADQSLRSIDAAMQSLQIEIAQHDYNIEIYSQDLYDKLKGRVTVSPSVLVFILLDAEGNLAYSSRTPNPNRVDLSNREYFRVHKEGRSAGLFIGTPVLGRVGYSAGKWIIPVSQALYGPDGQFAGIIGAILDVATLTEFYDSIDVGARGILLLTSREGVVLVQNTSGTNVLGQPLPGNRLFREILPRASVATIESTLLDDGVERLIGAHAIENYPVVAIAARDRRQALAAWQQNTLQGAIVTAALCTLLFAAGLVWRRLLVQEKNSRAALEASESFNRTLFEQTPVGLALSSLDGALIMGNRAFSDIIGHDIEDINRLTVAQLTPPEDCATERVRKEELQTQGTYGPLEKKLLHKDGRHIPVRITGLLVEGEGEPIVLSSIEDISSHKQAEENLRFARNQADSANRLKTQFLANMSHEIRTPMNAIFGVLDLLRDSRLDQDQQSTLKLAYESARQLLHMLNDILEFSRLENDRIELEKIPFALHHFLDRTVEIFKEKIRAKHLRLQLDIPSDLPDNLIGDPHRLRQVLTNLLENAIKFTPSGTITLKVERSQSAGDSCCLRFSVSDTGIGIPADKLDRLFKSFSQADTSHTREFGGTGLGLAICRRIVTLMGGEILVASQPEKGTTFMFTAFFEQMLPGQVAEPQPQSPPEQASTPLQFATPPRILVAEDNPVNRMMTRRLLEKRGWVVETAENGQIACAKLREEGFDLILMDVQMPEMDGYEATRKIRGTQSAHIPIIALTAHALGGDRERCVEAGMDDYLAKPVQAGELYALCEHYLQKAKPSSI